MTSRDPTREPKQWRLAGTARAPAARRARCGARPIRAGRAPGRPDQNGAPEREICRQQL